MKLSKLLLAVAVATLVFGSLVGVASARNISSSSSTLRATFATVEFRGSGGTTTRCAVTLEGSLHSRSFSKVVGSLIGYINRAAVSGCAATILAATLPWHIRYSSFFGLLPNITSIRTNVIGFAIQTAEPLFAPCLITSTTEEPFVQIYNRDIATEVLTSTLVGGEIRTRGCLEGTMLFIGTSNSLTVAGAATRITARLV
jgi:hypothetical protein